MSNIEKIFPNYLSAMAECGDGYNDPDIARVIALRTAQLNGQLSRRIVFDNFASPLIAIGIARVNLTDEHPFRVLDFGGGCGIHYFFARHGFDIPMKWAVVETPSMAMHARSVGGGSFEVFEEIGTAASFLGHVDLVIASGAIPYTPDPVASLDVLIALKASYFMLGRLPVWHDQTTIGVQESWLTDHMSVFTAGTMPPSLTNRVVKHPVTFVNIDRIIAKLETCYRIVLSLPSPSGNYEVLGKKVSGTSFICSRKT